jgi:hypothetical protein
MGNVSTVLSTKANAESSTNSEAYRDNYKEELSGRKNTIRSTRRSMDSTSRRGGSGRYHSNKYGANAASDEDEDRSFRSAGGSFRNSGRRAVLIEESSDDERSKEASVRIRPRQTDLGDLIEESSQFSNSQYSGMVSNGGSKASTKIATGSFNPNTLIAQSEDDDNHQLNGNTSDRTRQTPYGQLASTKSFETVNNTSSSQHDQTTAPPSSAKTRKFKTSSNSGSNSTFPKVGISLAYLKDNFLTRCAVANRDQLKGMTILDVVETYIKPLTQEKHISWAQLLEYEFSPFSTRGSQSHIQSNHTQQGKMTDIANVYLMYDNWQNTEFLSVFDALTDIYHQYHPNCGAEQLHTDRSPAQGVRVEVQHSGSVSMGTAVTTSSSSLDTCSGAMPIYVWWDIFSLNLHKTNSPHNIQSGTSGSGASGLFSYTMPKLLQHFEQYYVLIPTLSSSNSAVVNVYLLYQLCLSQLSASHGARKKLLTIAIPKTAKIELLQNLLGTSSHTGNNSNNNMKPFTGEAVIDSILVALQLASSPSGSEEAVYDALYQHYLEGTNRANAPAGDIPSKSEIFKEINEELLGPSIAYALYRELSCYLALMSDSTTSGITSPEASMDVMARVRCKVLVAKLAKESSRDYERARSLYNEVIEELAPIGDGAEICSLERVRSSLAEVEQLLAVSKNQVTSSDE